jgi:hypothetical protein
MQYKHAEIADTVYFWFAANLVTGAAGDGASPLYDVRLAGAASDAAPTASGTPTLLTHANYTDGVHEIAIDTAGYAAGEYAVFCTLTISSVNPAGFCGSFKLRTAGTGALQVGIVRPAGAVATDAGNSATAFKTTLTSAVNNFWVGAYLKITSGALSGQVRKVSGYDGTTKIITLASALTGTPADDVTISMVNE